MFFSLAGATCEEDEPVPGPRDLTVVRNSEGPIQYLTWATPEYEVAGFLIEWRFQDVFHWSPQSGLRVSNQGSGRTEANQVSTGALTRGLDVGYCYRVRAETPSERLSAWSEESCENHWNYWLTQPFGRSFDPGRARDLSVTTGFRFSTLRWEQWDVTTNTVFPDGDILVDVWRRGADSSDYDVIPTLPVAVDESGHMQYIDEGGTPEHCYRVAAKTESGVKRLSNDACPQPLASRDVAELTTRK